MKERHDFDPLPFLEVFQAATYDDLRLLKKLAPKACAMPRRHAPRDLEMLRYVQCEFDTRLERHPIAVFRERVQRALDRGGLCVKRLAK